PRSLASPDDQLASLVAGERDEVQFGSEARDGSFATPPSPGVAHARRMAIPLNYSRNSPQSRLEQMPHDRIGPANNSPVLYLLFIRYPWRQKKSPPRLRYRRAAGHEACEGQQELKAR